MLIEYRCPRCFEPNRQVRSRIFSLPDSFALNLTCDNGHATSVVISNFRFELLFKFALSAISDGYYREAISSFSATLERFYEFFLRVLFHKQHGSFENFDAFWNKVKNSSERQIGAFCAILSFQTGTAGPLLSSNDSALRNAVVHKGKFPSRDEAIEFGQAIADIVLKHSTYLERPEYQESILQYTIYNMSENLKTTELSDSNTTMDLGALIWPKFIVKTCDVRALCDRFDAMKN